ncbi:uncharacterized protein LOC114516812 [Dendronephthya gigantea]|uniref:uncharacterized protein LOC114516812 n=1 Tax=Dendronephthya gigantea TaxID=151771 RepID=UPI00106C8389|nr:uncharacterized protein LOC114516812 [Dendronephthya gigantea]
MRRTAIAHICIILSSVLADFTRGKSGGFVRVKLVNFKNKNHTDFSGGCCATKCLPCDYKFSIWITCDGKTTDSSCLYGWGKTGVFYGVSEISFTQDLRNGLHNPLTFNFTSFQGNLGIRILATNPNGSEIHNYRFHYSVYPTIYNKKTWRNSTLPARYSLSNSQIQLRYQVYCKEHYYSPSCTVGCLPGPNYKCDENTGRKLCIKGYVGQNCTCKPSHQYNCDITTGDRICYKPWFGVNCDVKCQPRKDALSGYKCDGKTGAKVCLKGWYGSECNETTRVTSELAERSTKIRPKTLAHNSQQTTSGFFPSKSSRLQNIIPTSKLIISPLKMSLITSPLMTSSSSTLLPPTKLLSRLVPLFTTPPITPSSTVLPATMLSRLAPSFTTPLMTSSHMTSLSMTSSEVTSHFASYVLSTYIEGSKATSSTVRNLTGIIEDRNLETTRDSSHRVKQSRNNTKLTVPISSDNTGRVKEDKEHVAQSTKPGVIEEDFASMCCDVKFTSTSRVTTPSPGTTDERKGRNAWWIILMTLLIIAIILIVTGISVYRKKYRKHKILPHYGASMKEFQIQAESNGLDKQNSNNMKNNSAEEDLDAIWRVMVTSHE